jgi:hypothetical protein
MRLGAFFEQLASCLAVPTSEDTWKSKQASLISKAYTHKAAPKRSKNDTDGDGHLHGCNDVSGVGDVGHCPPPPPPHHHPKIIIIISRPSS